MRFLVVTSYVPFEMGGNERLALALVKELKKSGYEADCLFTPQNRHYFFRSLMAGYVANYLTDVKEVNGKRIDRVVTLKFPSFTVRHPVQLCWFAHRQREYYDQWEEWFAYQKRIGAGRRRNLKEMVTSYGIEDSVTLAGALTVAEVFKHLARCRAVFFAPENEDCGLVAVEAMRSHKPVITCIGSGRPTKLIRDGTNGFVLHPDPEAIARRIDQLSESIKFGIHCVKGNPEGKFEEDSIPIHRFDFKNHDNLQRLASRILLRRVQSDLKGRSYPNEDPETWNRFLVSVADQRIFFYQSLYKFCRGIASPGLLSFLRTRTREFDGVLATMVQFNTMAYSVKAAHKARRPVGVIPLFHHLDWYHHWSHFYETLREADRLFVLNDDSVSLLNRMGCRATRLGVGFDPGDFPCEPEGARGFRDRFHLPKTGAMALFVGRKVQSKRYDLAMETIRRLRSKGYDVFLVMVGPEEDKQAISGDSVFYLNRLPRRELLHAYQACDFLLEPTEFESFGIIFCEAWMYEKPVIGNRRCLATSSLIRHRKDGFLCSTVEEFSASVITLLREPESGRKMGKLGRQKVLSEYTWHRVVKKIEAGLFQDRGDIP